MIARLRTFLEVIFSKVLQTCHPYLQEINKDRHWFFWWRCRQEYFVEKFGKISKFSAGFGRVGSTS